DEGPSSGRGADFRREGKLDRPRRVLGKEDHDRKAESSILLSHGPRFKGHDPLARSPRRAPRSRRHERCRAEAAQQIREAPSPPAIWPTIGKTRPSLTHDDRWPTEPTDRRVSHRSVRVGPLTHHFFGSSAFFVVSVFLGSSAFFSGVLVSSVFG